MRLKKRRSGTRGGRRFEIPAKDKLHDAVVRALLKDGWRIVSDSQTIKFNGRTLYLDIVAEKDGRRIVVEVKGAAFHEMAELEKAIGQYILYRFVLEKRHPDLTLFLAAPCGAFERIFGTSQNKESPQQATGYLNEWEFTFLCQGQAKRSKLRGIKPKEIEVATLTSR